MNGFNSGRLLWQVPSDVPPRDVRVTFEPYLLKGQIPRYLAQIFTAFHRVIRIVSNTKGVTLTASHRNTDLEYVSEGHHEVRKPCIIGQSGLHALDGVAIYFLRGTMRGLCSGAPAHRGGVAGRDSRAGNCAGWLRLDGWPGRRGGRLPHPAAEDEPGAAPPVRPSHTCMMSTALEPTGCQLGARTQGCSVALD